MIPTWPGRHYGYPEAGCRVRLANAGSGRNVRADAEGGRTAQLTRNRAALTDRIRRGQPDELRRRNTGPLVRRDVAEPPVRFPVLARLTDLLRRPRDEVPPHEDRFPEG